MPRFYYKTLQVLQNASITTKCGITPSSLSVKADWESKNAKTEWKLLPKMFQEFTKYYADPKQICLRWDFAIRYHCLDVKTKQNCKRCNTSKFEQKPQLHLLSILPFESYFEQRARNMSSIKNLNGLLRTKTEN